MVEFIECLHSEWGVIPSGAFLPLPNMHGVHQYVRQNRMRNRGNVRVLERWDTFMV